MSSLITPEPLAIKLDQVSKIYQLYGSQGDQLIDVLGLQKIGLKPRTKPKEFIALNNVSLDVKKGQRVGIVGRNGAGKTTLLKLICGNFAPSKGVVTVNGKVQALMNIGVGFHPEFTGRENVAASLQYSGLTRQEYAEAIEGVVEFCELGEFLDQPFKTYSLGMQARVMFAAATAIKPNILIVDEVLGAGDAYFVNKSKQRVEKLVNSGCTMLLVSHSMQQVLELCDEAVWIHQGQQIMQDKAFLVVKAYEEHLHGAVKPLHSKARNPTLDTLGDGKEVIIREGLAAIDEPVEPTDRGLFLPGNTQLQQPTFLPHSTTPRFPELPSSMMQGMQFLAPGGQSNWEGQKGIKFVGFVIVTSQGISNELVTLKPAKFVMTVQAENSQKFYCRYGIAIFDYMGTCVTKLVSPPDEFDLTVGAKRKIEMLLNPNQLGPGEYIVSLSVHEVAELELFNITPRYDLVARSFVFTVIQPASIAPLAASFAHTSEWKFGADVSVQEV